LDSTPQGVVLWTCPRREVCGINADIQTVNEETSLYLAFSRGELDVVRLLIEQGAGIHIGDSNNPLHIASLNGYLDVVQLLFNTGIPVDVRNGTQKTPLALASGEGKVEVGLFPIHQGADLNARDIQS
jgi:ankyrin repeat protein